MEKATVPREYHNSDFFSGSTFKSYYNEILNHKKSLRGHDHCNCKQTCFSFPILTVNRYGSGPRGLFIYLKFGCMSCCWNYHGKFSRDAFVSALAFSDPRNERCNSVCEALPLVSAQTCSDSVNHTKTALPRDQLWPQAPSKYYRALWWSIRTGMKRKTQMQHDAILRCVGWPSFRQCWPWCHTKDTQPPSSHSLGLPQAEVSCHFSSEKNVI